MPGRRPRELHAGGSADTDRDGVCNLDDLCEGDDATGDTDGDGNCDDIDVCRGDDLASWLASGHTSFDRDRDRVCDLEDLCEDADGDGTCGGCADADLDGCCDEVDTCLGADGDGVCAPADVCPSTAPGAVVDADGCAIADRAPCAGDWRNHGAYVSAVAAAAAAFVDQGPAVGPIVRDAARSTCGR